MKFIRNKISISNFKNKLESGIKSITIAYSNLKEEGVETIEALSIIKTSILKKEKINEKDIMKIIEQSKDVVKLTLLIPLAILPGSPITIPILYKIANKYNIDITPSSFKKEEKNTIDDNLSLNEL